MLVDIMGRNPLTPVTAAKKAKPAPKPNPGRDRVKAECRALRLAQLTDPALHVFAAPFWDKRPEDVEKGRKPK